ncbi:YDG domain-containing protein, partial [Acinetobacter sp. WCHAc060025]|uniref:YDG domain-containing protein n=1 Tax=Acinetobacter sp. WCHAc060025 TaxID=2518625 RepID=UPI001023EA9C
MNKIYKVIWNTQLGCWQAVSELAKNHSSSQSTTTTAKKESHLVHKVSQLILFGMALLPLSIHAAISNVELPTGAQINTGSASFNQNNNTLNINQNSQNLSTNWNSFNIGKDATVNFNQPNQSSTAINHVLDSNASQIMGRLNANGQVFLLNPNGVVFSKTAQVNVGGLVASTLNLNDTDIQNGKYTLKGDANSTSAIENNGAINTLQGGTVALIAPNVKNTGTIKTPNGTTHLTSASQVTLALQDGSLTQYQVEQGVLQGLVDNGGAIIADNGAVYLTAKAKDSLSKAVVNHTGVIEANRLSQNAKGEIILLGDMQYGETKVSGTLKAEGKNGADGGFIETSAAYIDIGKDAKVSTLSDTAKTGEWLIDPYNVTITNANQAGNSNSNNTFTPSQNDSVINVNTLTNALGSNNITVTTAGAGTQAGNINVNADVTWNANTALTLRADNDININANITANGATGKLNLEYGQTTSNTAANYYLNNGAKVSLKAGHNFSTKKGTNAVKNYTVITSLGSAGSRTGTDLQGINGNLFGDYVLGADIDASSTWEWNSYTGFDSIGYHNVSYPAFGLPSNPFRGTFDGLGHTIKSLTIGSSDSGIGLFAETSSNAVIRNVGLTGIDYTGYERAGGLVAKNYGLIENSYVTGKILSFESDFGGLVGWNDTNAKITGSFADVDITSRWGNSSRVGGLVGVNQGTIENSYATGDVVGTDTVGGLVGSNEQGTIKNSYSSGKVGWSGKGSQLLIGGLAGFSQGTIENSYWNTSTSGRTTSAGGTGQTTAQLQQLSTFSNWSIDAAGSTGKIWRIYEGQSSPLLRSFLRPYEIDIADSLPSTKIYDGLATGMISLGLNYTTSSKNVGTYSLSDGTISISGSPTAVDTTQFGYDLTYKSTGAGTLEITKKDLNISGLSASNRDYNSTAVATLNGTATISVIAGDAVSLIGTGVGSFLDKNVGDNKTVKVTGFSLLGTDADNYNLIQPTNLTANILPAQATITGLIVPNKIYDGTTNVIIDSSGMVLTGIFSGDELILSNFSGNFSNKNVGDNKTFSSVAFSQVGSDISNYRLVVGNLTGNITKANMFVTGVTASNKTYDATKSATLNGTSATINKFLNDDVRLIGTGIGSFLNKNAGDNKVVNVTGYTLAGIDAGNYNLVQPTGLTANITKADISVVGITASNKIYDATKSATLNGTAIIKGFTGDNVSLIGTGIGSFSDKNAGDNKAVNVTGYSLDGIDAGNYNLVQPTNLTANISRAIYYIAGLKGNNKIYDGNNYSSVNIDQATLTGIMPGDDLKLSSVSATFNDKNVGNNKTITIGDISATGLDSGNYLPSISQSSVSTANITPRALNITSDAQNRIYDGTNTAQVNLTDDRIANDQLSVSGNSSFADKNVGTGKTVTTTGLSLSGVDASNYVLASNTATDTANITARTLNITSDAQNRVYDGTNTAQVNLTDDRILNDQLSVSGNSRFADKNVGTGKTVTTTGLSLSGVDAGNYVLASNTATDTADITVRTLNITSDAQNRVYDGTNTAQVNLTDDRILNDQLSVSGNSNF